MTKQNNAARVAVQAEPCPNLAPVDCSAVFGVKFPEDVIAPIRVAQERLSWLEHLFNCIATDPQAGLCVPSVWPKWAALWLWRRQTWLTAAMPTCWKPSRKAGQHEHH